MGLLSGLTGAVGGLFSGGVPGAILGGIGGLVGGGDQNTGDRHGISTSRPNLRAWTDPEQQMLQQAQAGIGNANMTPEQAAQMEAQYQQNLFNPAAAQLQNTHNQASGQTYAANARRGAGNSSRNANDSSTLNAGLARDTANLQAQTTLAAAQMRQAEEANRRAAAAQMRAQIDSLWQNRLQSSGITTADSGNYTQTGPDNTLGRTLGTVFQAMGNPDSYFNTHGVLGMGGPPKPNDDPKPINGPIGGFLNF